eukprot:352088-Chlamydomonas_euryale.AAC.13
MGRRSTGRATPRRQAAAARPPQQTPGTRCGPRAACARRPRGTPCTRLTPAAIAAPPRSLVRVAASDGLRPMSRWRG